MAYDDLSPQMNVGDSLPDNPHQVIEQISVLDSRISEAQDSKRQLIEHYKRLMDNYQKHFNEVVNVPMEAEMSVGRY